MVSTLLARTVRASAAMLLAGAAIAGCDTKESAHRAIDAIWDAAKPEEMPVMLNRSLPFHYPQDLYAKKVQGNVILRIYIDTDGRVHPESTSVAESSGFPGLDSAAVKGAEQLQFVPAKTGGEPLALSLLFPVYFRHPDAAPLPGDTILARPAVPAAPAKRP